MCWLAILIRVRGKRGKADVLKSKNALIEVVSDVCARSGITKYTEMNDTVAIVDVEERYALPRRRRY